VSSLFETRKLSGKKEFVMFRLVGWFVVTGFALYGVREFIDHHVVAEKD
jgi:hypothetical protein